MMEKLYSFKLWLLVLSFAAIFPYWVVGKRVSFVHFQTDASYGYHHPKNGLFLYDKTKNFTHQFEITMTNLKDLQQQRVSALFDVRLNPVEKAHEICSVFRQDLVNQKETNARCMIPLIHSIRWRLANALSNLSIHYQHYPQDGELYGLLYAYEESGSFPSLVQDKVSFPAPSAPSPRKIRRACILGEPHASSLFPALTSLIVNEVVVIRDPSFGLDTAHFDPEVYAWSDDFYVIAAMLGKSLLTIDSLSDLAQRRCHIIQIEPQIALAPEELRQVIDRLLDPLFLTPHTLSQEAKEAGEREREGSSLSSALSSPHLLARIVWNRYFHSEAENPRNQKRTKISSSSTATETSRQGQSPSTHHQPYQSLFSWHLQNTWCVYAQFELLVDSNGFTEKGYSFDDQRLDFLVTTSIALYSPAVSSSSASATLLSSPAKKAEAVEASSNSSSNSNSSTSKLIRLLETQRQFLRNRLDYVILVTTVNRVLVENVLGLGEALKALGFRQVQVVYDLTLSAYESLYLASGFSDDRILQISLGPSDISLFARQFIGFNTEQRWENLVFGKTFYRFHEVLSRAVSVWCFYEPLSKHLSEAMGYRDTHTITLYTLERPLATYQLIAPTVARALGPANQREVLFFGSPSPRRVELLNFLYQAFLPYQQQQAPQTAFVMRMITGSWHQLSFDYERDIFVSHASLVLNINNNEDSALETHRLNYLLSAGKCVISERGSDPRLPLLYGEAVVFVRSKEEMAQRTIELMMSLEKRRLCEERAREQFEKINRDYTALDLAMNKILFHLSNQSAPFTL